MKILVQRNWEDVTCPGCRSELRLHPGDIQNSRYEDTRKDQYAAVTRFWVRCPVCSNDVPVNPPEKYKSRLTHGRWPSCPCEGDKAACRAHESRGGYGQCDWSRDLDYTSPTD